MNLNYLNEAIEEADRFLVRAKQLRDAMHDSNPKQPVIYGFPSEQGAVRRSSMDLTRALSKLRNK